MRLYRLLLVLYWLPLLVWAQQAPAIKPVYDEQYAQQFQFDRYSQEEMGNPFITRIRNQNGYVWMSNGTHQLTRFDGTNFVNVSFYIDGKLSRNSPSYFFLDSQKGLWISTLNGLYWCEDSEALQKNRQVPSSVSLELKKVPWKFLKSNKFPFVSGEDKQGNLWITQESSRKLFRYNPKMKRLKTFSIASDRLIASWLVDKNGQIWVLSEKELYRFNARNQLFEPLSIFKTLGLSKEAVCNRLLADRQGSLWLATDRSGVFKLRFKPGEPAKPESGPVLNDVQHFLFNNVWAITQDGAGRVWFGSTTDGLCLYDYSTRASYRLNITNRDNGKEIQTTNVGSLFTDETGIVWVGHLHDALYAYDPSKMTPRILVTNEQDTKKSNLTWVALAHGDSLYLYGEARKRMQLYSISKRKYIDQLPPYTQPNASIPGTFLRDESGTNWTVDEAGICTYNALKQTYDFFPLAAEWQYNLMNTVYYTAIVVSKQWSTNIPKRQEIWVGLPFGVARFDIGSRQWIKNSDLPSQLNSLLANRNVQAIQAGTDHTIWLGVMKVGLIRYTQKTGKVAVWDANKQGISFIWDIHEDQSSVWVCTDNGLYELSRNDLSTKAHYSREKGTLSSNEFSGLIKDKKGHLWMTSNHELIELVPGKGASRTYSFKHDLKDNLFSIDQDKYGTLYLQGEKGISYFHPDEIKPNRFMPPVKITGITVMDSSYAPNLTELSLPHDQNFVAFDFVALNFSSPEKNQYQYRLQGVDDKWVQAGTTRSANYTKLAPGTYVFTVIGSNNDGVWNKTGASVTVIIRPPWWGTWWFRLLLIALLVAGIYGLFRYRLQQILRQREAEIKASLMAQESERQRFSRELHDGVGANLSLLKMYLTSFGNPDISMDTLKDRSESLLASSVDDIRRLIHDMHPRNLQELGLVRAVEEMVQVVNLSKRVQVSFTADEVPLSLSETLEINLYRIIQELLQNAVKHAGATDISLQLTYQADKLQLSYSDNGQGFDPAVASLGNGLLNIRNRVELLKGKVEVQSVKGDGTVVKIETRVGSY